VLAYSQVHGPLFMVFILFQEMIPNEVFMLLSYKNLQLDAREILNKGIKNKRIKLQMYNHIHHKSPLSF
jgi:hypothetical protein